ncbi:MAG: transcriptional regulator [Betaproteobacteria bacterium]|nr:MAG: transcriptional regulator [Betaproteobacteria bacterium]
MRNATRLANPGDIRRKLGLNQSEFWGKIGVTQSGGSRYESGRNMPRPVRELLRLVHIEGIDLTRAKGEDFAIAEQLKRSNARLYEKMRSTVRSSASGSSRRPAGRKQ